MRGFFAGTSFETRGFLWSHGSKQDLGTLGGNYTSPADIDEVGRIVGSSQPRGSTDSTDRSLPFLWQNGRMRRIGTLTTAHLIGPRGQIVGRVGWRVAVWREGKVTRLGAFGGPKSSAADINRRGWIVGTADTMRKDRYGGHLGRAFVWRNGRMIDLGTLGGPSSRASAINDDGWIVGWATTRIGAQHAVVWRPR
jgi:probable HAF family extracellular repeat protein